MKLHVRDFSCWAICKYYEQSYPSHSPKFSYIFHPGIYALTGQIINGGWAFTYALSTGRRNTRKLVIYNNPEYYIDDRPVDMETLRGITCTLGYYRPRWFAKLGVRDESGEHRLKKALKKHKPIHTYEELVDKLGLSDCRLTRPIDRTSGERWRITAAIGLAENKKIFCFPWMTNSEFKTLTYAASKMGDLIAANGGILLIPIENSELVRDFVDDVVDLSQPEIFCGEQV